MRNFWRTILAFCLGLSGMMVFFVPLAYGQVAVLTDKAGTIKVVNGRTGEARELRGGDAITKFDKITVPKDGSAQFVFSNGNSLQLSSDSSVAVEDYEFDKTTGIDYSVLNLDKGKARFSSPNSYSADRNSAILKTPKMKLSGKSDFNVVVQAWDEKTEAVNLKGEVEAGLETDKRKLSGIDTLKPGFKIRNRSAEEAATAAASGDTKPFASEEAEAGQLETVKKEMDLPVNRGPYDQYAKNNPSFATRYKPAAYQKLRRRMKAKAKK